MQRLRPAHWPGFPLPPSEDGSEPALPTDAEFLADFNRDPRIVVVATGISAEALRIFDYLGRHGIRIDAHEFKYFESPQGEKFIYRRTAHESPSGPGARPPAPTGYASADELAQYVKNNAIREWIYSVPEWVDEEFDGNAVVDVRIPGPGHFRLRVLGQTSRVGWYFAQQWMYAWAVEPLEDDVAVLTEAGLSKPNELKTTESGYLRFHVAAEADLPVFKSFIARHVRAEQQALTTS